MKLKRDDLVWIGIVIGALFAVTIYELFGSHNATKPSKFQDTAELWQVVDSIVTQTPWDRLALEQRILQKARKGR